MAALPSDTFSFVSTNPNRSATRSNTLLHRFFFPAIKAFLKEFSWLCVDLQPYFIFRIISREIVFIPLQWLRIPRANASLRVIPL